MRIQVMLELDVKEIETNGVEESALERLADMSTDRVCDLVQIGFLNLFGNTEVEGAMFDGEDHLLSVADIEIKSVRIVEKNVMNNVIAKKDEKLSADEQIIYDAYQMLGAIKVPRDIEDKIIAVLDKLSSAAMFGVIDGAEMARSVLRSQGIGN